MTYIVTMKRDITKLKSRYKKAYNFARSNYSKEYLINNVPLNALYKGKVSDFLYKCRCEYCTSRIKSKTVKEDILKDNLEELC